MTRYLFIILIILLYLIPFFQNHLFSQRSGLNRRTVQSQEERHFPFKATPFYSEYFVNQEKPGTISHVSSITPAGDHKMASTWYGGSGEGERDVAIYLSIFHEEEGRWTEPVVLVDREKSSKELNRYVKKVGNSLVFSDMKGRLWLFYVTIAFGGWSGSSLNYKVSPDEGVTWSKSRRMLLSPFFNLTNNVKNKGIHLDDGTFLLPVYHEFIKKFSQLLWIRPEDSNLAYEIRKMTRERKAIQPSLLPAGEKNLVAFFRNMESGEKNYILKASINDLGQRWSTPVDTPLPNPNSGFDMIRLEDGSYLGVINNSFSDRSNLTLVLSHDGGKTWRLLKVLENLPEKSYEYPSISEGHGGLYHLTYSYEKKRIKHVVFNDAWIKQF